VGPLSGNQAVTSGFNDFFVAAFFICTTICTTTHLLKRADTFGLLFLEMIVILKNNLESQVICK
jgi:hypothetical protein